MMILININTFFRMVPPNQQYQNILREKKIIYCSTKPLERVANKRVNQYYKTCSRAYAQTRKYI